MPSQTSSVAYLLEAAVHAGMFPGAVAGWASADGRSSFTVVGSRALVPDRCPMRADAWFDLASLTKPLVTTTLCLLAFRYRVLDLGTRVGEVLPEAAGTPTARLTIGELLTHTSGLPAWRPLYALVRGAEPDRALVALTRLEPETRAGERVVYSCPGFLLLGFALERVLAEPLDRALSRHVLEPLGLTDELGFAPAPEQRPLVAGARRPGVELRLVREAGLDPATLPPVASGMPDDGNARFLGGVAGNAGLFGTLRGVLELAGQYLEERCRLLSCAEIGLATRCWTPGLEQGRGLGWQLATTPGCSAGSGLDPASFGHTGFTGTSLWVDPTRRAVLVLLTNRHHPAHRETDLHPVRRRFHTLAAREVADVGMPTCRAAHD